MDIEQTSSHSTGNFFAEDLGVGIRKAAHALQRKVQNKP